jgi:hypothetical protein
MGPRHRDVTLTSREDVAPGNRHEVWWWVQGGSDN